MFYDGRNEPRIVIGPDWSYSLAELVIINSIAGYFVGTIDMGLHPWLFQIGLATLLI